eukprot:TRINITY_DN3202_c0_g1_i7.p1 TRINITY_DN3202_c0_g1~~TRINITY_DN3202_c0_g1_i7.p1  ORF type:complete len:239 (-),score=7.63 TRINITY_DN3202_c0_g1_i7:102-818(-)
MACLALPLQSREESPLQKSTLMSRTSSKSYMYGISCITFKTTFLALSLGVVIGLQLDSDSRSQCAESEEEFLFGIPARHGKVEKKGVVPLEKWYNVNLQEVTNTAFTEVDRKGIKYQDGEFTVNGSFVETPPKIPFTGKCGVYVNHEHKFIYLRSPKVASTSLMMHLGWLCNLNGKEKDCLRQASIETIPTPEAALQMWHDYFVFAVARYVITGCPLSKTCFFFWLEFSSYQTATTMR